MLTEFENVLEIDPQGAVPYNVKSGALHVKAAHVEHHS